MTNKYYQRHKENLPKEACQRYQNLSEEEEKKKRQYHRQTNKNLSEEEKEKKVEYMKNYYLTFELLCGVLKILGQFCFMD